MCLCMAVCVYVCVPAFALGVASCSTHEVLVIVIVGEHTWKTGQNEFCSFDVEIGVVMAQSNQRSREDFGPR